MPTRRSPLLPPLPLPTWAACMNQLPRFRPPERCSGGPSCCLAGRFRWLLLPPAGDFPAKESHQSSPGPRPRTPGVQAAEGFSLPGRTAPAQGSMSPAADCSAGCRPTAYERARLAAVCVFRPLGVAARDGVEPSRRGACGRWDGQPESPAGGHSTRLGMGWPSR